METAPSSADSTLNNNFQGNSPRIEPEKDLVTWMAPSRPFKRHSRRFYVTTFSMAGIVSIIIFLAEGIMPVILIVSLIFLIYVLSTVQPEIIEYKVTNKGIKIGASPTGWQNLVRFCFTAKSGSEMLTFNTVSFPGKMELVINQEIKEQLKKEISNYVPYEEIPLSTLDRITNWISKKLPES